MRNLTGLRICLLLSFAASVAVLTTAGCHTGQSEPFVPDPQVLAIQIKDGQQKFVAVGCLNCHSLSGAGANTAPDLTREGSRHDSKWIFDQIFQPKTHNPSTRMPSSEGKIDNISGGDIAEYLASLK